MWVALKLLCLSKEQTLQAVHLLVASPWVFGATFLAPHSRDPLLLLKAWEPSLLCSHSISLMPFTNAICIVFANKGSKVAGTALNKSMPPVLGETASLRLVFLAGMEATLAPFVVGVL